MNKNIIYRVKTGFGDWGWILFVSGACVWMIFELRDAINIYTVFFIILPIAYVILYVSYCLSAKVELDLENMTLIEKSYGTVRKKIKISDIEKISYLKPVMLGSGLGVPCWRSKVNFDMIIEGKRIRKTYFIGIDNAENLYNEIMKLKKEISPLYEDAKNNAFADLPKSEQEVDVKMMGLMIASFGVGAIMFWLLVKFNAVNLFTAPSVVIVIMIIVYFIARKK